MAFGTGHHATTRACLELLERIAPAGRDVLDIGTGSGILAIAIAKAAKARVVASDSDPLAVAVARDNVRLNGVGGRVRVVHAAGLPGRAFAALAPADLIVANILAGPLVALAPAIRRRLAPGGVVVLSGLLPDQEARIVGTYRGIGLRLSGARVVDGWLTVTMERGGRRCPTARVPGAAHREVVRCRPGTHVCALG
jgi:ribosomal protein L11 methyltransferase